MRPTIDLNADLGEGFGRWQLGDDAAMLNLVSSANIACGFHAGDPLMLRQTATAALATGVTIGAHVSYRDLAGFGRRFMDASEQELASDVLYQISALDGVARAAGTKVSYVKPHGALYHACISHEPHARAVVTAVADFGEVTGQSLTVLLPPGPEGEDVLGHRYARAAGLPTAREVFADRAYNSDGTLVSRREPGALIVDIPRVLEAVQRFVEEDLILATDGSPLKLEADTVCLHGDTPGAVAMAEAIRAALESADVQVRSFA